LAEAALGHGGDLVDHQTARGSQAAVGRWFHLDTKDWSFNRLTGQWTHGDRGLLA
jgi:hypothetical protein